MHIVQEPVAILATATFILFVGLLGALFTAKQYAEETYIMRKIHGEDTYKALLREWKTQKKVL